MGEYGYNKMQTLFLGERVKKTIKVYEKGIKYNKGRRG